MWGQEPRKAVLLEAGESQGTFSSGGSRRNCHPNSDPNICKIIRLCYFKLLGSW